MSNMTSEELIKTYQLEKHPEGGYFRETYRAEGKIAGSGKNFSTAIYFLLPSGEKSRLHRIKADEIWHFYLGGPLTVSQIFPNGMTAHTVLGSDVVAGHQYPSTRGN